MTTLVTFGSSWPEGVELNDHEFPYGNILADLLNVDYYKNYAEGNTSNDHMVLQLEKYIQHNKNIDKTIAVFFITEISRMCMIDYSKNALCVTPWGNSEQGDMPYYYYKFFHTPHQELFRIRLTILALQKICNQYNIDDYYILGWDKPDLDFPGINLDKFYQSAKFNCAELFGAKGNEEFANAKENKYIYPNICHPNQAGHQLIADELYKWIKNAKN